MDDDPVVTGVWLLRIVGAIAALLVVVVVIRRRASRVESGLLEGTAVASSVGGGTWFAWSFPWGATWPLVRLDQFTWGIRIGPNFRWIAWAMPTTDMKWSDILRVKRTTTTIRFTRKNAPGWVSFGFLGYQPPPLLVAALEEHGITYES